MSKKHYSTTLFFILFLTVATALVLSQNAEPEILAEVETSAPVSLSASPLDNNNCRAGASGPVNAFPWAETMGLGWVSTYGVEGIAAEKNYMPMVRLKGNGDFTDYTITPDLATIESLASQHPGRLWQVGNEPDIRGQDRLTPALYARAYGEVHEAIKRGDPTALVANGPTALLTPSRLQYWDLVWEAYQQIYGSTIPIDVWSSHLYIFAEGPDGVAIGTDSGLHIEPYLGDPAACTNPSDNSLCIAEHDSAIVFEKHLRDFRQWMKAHGQQDKPLIITEWSVLWPYVIDNPGTPQESCFVTDELGGCFTPSRVNNYMSNTIAVMNETDPAIGNPNDNNRLVQKYMWFSFYVDPEYSGGGGSSSLLKTGYQEEASGDIAALSPMGWNFKNLSTAPGVLKENLHITGEPIVPVVTQSGTASAEIRVRFNNNGSLNTQIPFAVGFYRDAALTDLIGTVNVSTAEGCGLREYEATLIWNNLSLGEHKYWAKVDIGGAISETSVTDNVVEGTVFIGTHQVFLPVVR
ncbi:MAG: hypothetical protein ACPG8W_00910 [Candidatus Promineifilaceae bacterium]